MYSIEAKKLTKKFKDKIAVNGINLNIKKGELFALLGTNGAGKTTTIKMLSGLILPTSGNIKIENMDMKKDVFIIKGILNVSPQETAIAPNLTVKENLEFMAGVYQIDNKDKKMYIAQFSNDGKMVTGDVKYDKATGTYSLENATTSNIDSSIQGISTYHKDNKTYLIESRSYGSNKSNLTVRDITNGVENSTIVGSKSLGHEYSEAIHVDDKGKALILYEGGKFGQYDNTEMVDINNLISNGNGKVAKMGVDTSYDKGYESKDGYNTLM